MWGSRGAGKGILFRVGGGKELKALAKRTALSDTIATEPSKGGERKPERGGKSSGRD